jgi:hypothetical protein
MRRWVVLWLAIGACNLVAADAHADARVASKRPAPLAQSLTGAAKESFDSAQVLVNNGDFAGALAKFGQAYDVSHDPRLLFNMAVCQRNLHDYARMQQLLTRYEREAADSMSPKDKADVDGALAAIRNLVGSVRLAVSEAGASVAIDGEAAGTTPIADPIALNLGKHAFAIRKDGFEPAQQEVDIVGGSETPLSVTLVAHREAGRLVVAVSDAATVVVDAQAAVKGRFDAQLPIGPHEVRVTEPGKIPYKAQVDLRDGETRTLDVSLEDEKHRAPIWPWVVAGVAVAGASVGGYFLFRPQDTTQPVPAGKSGTFQLLDWRH